MSFSWIWGEFLCDESPPESREHGILQVEASVETSRHGFIWGFWKIRKLPVLNVTTQNWFSMRMRTKLGRRSMIWSSQEIPDYGPVSSALTALPPSHPSTSTGGAGGAGGADSGEKDTCLQSPDECEFCPWHGRTPGGLVAPVQVSFRWVGL